MEKRFDLSMKVSNSKGCGCIVDKVFIGKDVKLEDVKNFVRKHAVENKDLDIKYTVFEGWGMNQKQVWQVNGWIYN